MSYAWLPTKHMWADVLNKEIWLPDEFEKLLTDNDMDLPSVHINKVRAVEGEIRIENIRNHGVLEEQQRTLTKLVQNFRSKISTT